MMDLERRLQHAARELRELPIDTPPLGALASSRPRTALALRVPTLVAPVLFVLGGLVVIGHGVQGTPSEAEIPAASSVPAASGSVTPSPDAPTGPNALADTVTTTPTEELEIIATLVVDIDPRPAPVADAPIVRPGPTGVV